MPLTLVSFRLKTREQFWAYCVNDKEIKINHEICNSDPSQIGTSTQAKSSQIHPPPPYSTESYSLASEVVTCHADQGWTDTVVWVVRQSSSPTTSGSQLSSTSKHHQRIKSAAILEALVFECLGGEAEATAITR